VFERVRSPAPNLAFGGPKIDPLSTKHQIQAINPQTPIMTAFKRKNAGSRLSNNPTSIAFSKEGSFPAFRPLICAKVAEMEAQKFR
jgi:hypothetical protein